MRAIENAKREVSKGNLWRAREILQGSIPNAGYDCELFENLGIVLLKMGDLPEAGRFLFLSGRRMPAYEQPISLFLWKHRKNQPRALFCKFPRSARLSGLSEYPERVRLELTRLGFPEVLRDQRGKMLPSIRVSSGLEFIPTWLITVSILISIVVLMLLGVIKLIEIWHWLKRR
jgi:hypothetical protein